MRIVSFVVRFVFTMEVHKGEYHSKREECGLGYFAAKDLEELNLSTCQIYVCDDCYYTNIHIDEIKEHLENVHTSPYDKLIIFAEFSGSGVGRGGVHPIHEKDKRKEKICSECSETCKKTKDIKLTHPHP